ncbi:MAG: type II secretion system F family protein [bacterium]|nr:type II secretion system F family protein [bacterium]
MSTGLVVAAVTCSVTFATVGVAMIVRPLRRLGPRVRPYLAASRIGLGLSPDIRSDTHPGARMGDNTTWRRPSPPLSTVVDRLGRLLVLVDDEKLALRLRQSGLYPHLEDSLRPQAYRMGVLGRVVLFASGLTAVALVAGSSAARVVFFGLAGGMVGAFLARSRVANGVRRRRNSVRSELYTINQLIAMYARVGGGAIQGIRYVVARARGITVDDLAEVLLLHERGWSLSEALERAERLTPEPEAARTYRLIAISQEQGADLAEALLDLSRDLRAGRRDDLRRQAARRRVLMVIPVVVILAPVTILFMAAPIPSIVFGG